jgi:hypothetical protein
MQKTKNILLCTLWGTIFAAVLLVVFYEFSLWESGTLAESKKTEFICAVGMELVALSSIPLALRLFKFKKIANDLTTRKEKALLMWGMLRMLVLCGPVLCNLVLYYLFLNPTFMYLALIHAICLMFVYPTIDRCVAETTPQT